MTGSVSIITCTSSFWCADIRGWLLAVMTLGATVPPHHERSPQKYPHFPSGLVQILIGPTPCPALPDTSDGSVTGVKFVPRCEMLERHRWTCLWRRPVTLEFGWAGFLSRECETSPCEWQARQDTGARGEDVRR